MPSRDDSPLHAMMASSSSLSVQSLRARVPFVSQSALTSILEVVAKEGVPEQRKRKHIYDSTRQMLERMCLYGPLVISAVAYTLSDQAVEITFVNFLSLLAGTYAMADSWADYFDKVHAEFPSSYANPWGLICYADEVHPGNQLAGTARKVWCVYMSFVQFGRHLSKSELRCTFREHCWRECTGASKQWTVVEKRGQEYKVIFQISDVASGWPGSETDILQQARRWKLNLPELQELVHYQKCR